MDSRSVPSKTCPPSCPPKPRRRRKPWRRGIQNQQPSIGNPFLYHLVFHLALDLLDDFPELLTRIKIDLKRLFVTVIDHTTGPDHQLLFFKERFLPKDHPDRAKMARFAAKLGKFGLRKETIGYGPTKEQWEAFKANT